MKRVWKYKYWLSAILIVLILEKIFVPQIPTFIKERDYFIQETTAEYRSEIESKNGIGPRILCKMRTLVNYAFSTCFRFQDNQRVKGKKIAEKFGDGEVIIYDFIAPRSVTSFTRLLWGNEA